DGLPLASDLREAVERWLRAMSSGRGASDHTLAAYERDARQFLEWLKSDLGHAPCVADLAHVNAKRVRAFLAARRRQGAGSRTLARSLS
ncbi:site-specific integrase, partial [Acinetobacter baumannii]